MYHACQCRDANCRRPSCIKMKRVVSHTKACKRKNAQLAQLQGSGNGSGNGAPCPICKQLIALCCYHAKHCEETKCPVPYCVNIKAKLKHQQLQARMQQQSIVKRRIAAMNTLTQSQNNSSANNNSTATPFSPQPVSCLPLVSFTAAHYILLFPFLVTVIYEACRGDSSTRRSTAGCSSGEGPSCSSTADLADE